MYFEYQISSLERFCIISFNNMFKYDVYKDYKFSVTKSKYKTGNHFVSMSTVTKLRFTQICSKVGNINYTLSKNAYV